MRLLDKLKDFIDSLKQIQGSDSIIATFLGLITSGQLQVIDHRFVGVKDISGQSLAKLTDTSDTKLIGITNLDRGKPSVNQFMMVTSIKMLGLQAGAAITQASLKAANFGEISDVAGLQNALLTIKSDKKIIVNQLPMSCFLVGGRQDEKGVYHLAFPKPILPERDLDIEIEFGAGSVAPVNSAVKFELHGPCTSV